jgi:hypothetical protein
MPFVLGINFRQTAGYIADGTDEINETATTVNYPRSAGGTTLGYSSITGSLQTRNRTTAATAKLAGIVFVSTAGTFDYRVDLPAPGTYLIGGGVLEPIPGGVGDTRVDLYDSAALLATLWDQANIDNVFGVPDGMNTRHASASSWLSSRQNREVTFASTIAIFRVRSPTSPTAGDNRPVLSHLYVEQVETAIPATATPGPAQITFAGLAPTATAGATVSLGVGVLAWQGHAPTVSAGATASLGIATLSWQGWPPLAVGGSVASLPPAERRYSATLPSRAYSVTLPARAYTVTLPPRSYS